MSGYGDGREGRPGEGLDLEQVSVKLAELTEASAAADQAMARAAQLAGELAGSRLVERVEGLLLEQVLMLRSRMPGGDARFLITAGEVLADMPVVAGLFADGVVSWGIVRGIVAEVRRFGAAVRGAVDQRIAATLHDHGDLRVMDPDDLVDAVARAVVEARATSSVERSEERARRANQLHVQADFDGGIKGWFRYDPIVGAIILNALDAAADAITHAQRTSDTADDDTGDGAGGGNPQPDPTADAADAAAGDAEAGTATDPDHAADATDSTDPAADPAAEGDADATDTTEPDAPADDGDAGDDAGWEWRLGRARQYATALQRLSEFWLSGGRDGTGRAKPLIVVHVDLADVHANAAGTVELNVRGALPSLTLRTLEALSADADLRAVVFDGARPLAVSRKLALKDPSADTRVAVAARDRGDRWPGSRDPAAWCDVDHVHAREDGGSHHPDNLALLSRANHVRKHDHDWQVAIDGDSGMITITRRDVTYRSLPRGTPLSKPKTTRPPDGRPPDRTPRSGPPPSPGSPPPPRRTGPAPTGDADPPASAADDTLPF